jgi:hypothetical protein
VEEHIVTYNNAFIRCIEFILRSLDGVKKSIKNAGQQAKYEQISNVLLIAR